MTSEAAAAPMEVRPHALRRARSMGIPRPETAPLIPRSEDWVIFFAVALPLLALGLYAALHLHIYHVDALARSYSAVEVVRGFEPKLANLDLAWPPIPGLLQIPIAALLPNVTASGGAGPIISALATAVSAVVFNHILARKLDLRWQRFAVLTLTLLNPMVLGLAVSGVTEMPALVFLLTAWEAFLRLDEEASPIVPLAIMGMVTAALVLSRFEAAVIAAAMAVLVYVYLSRVRPVRAEQYRSAMWLSFAVPVLYAGAVFIFLCATITGNALYFLTGPGSNSPYTEVIVGSTPQLSRLVHAPFETIAYLVRSTVSFTPLTLLALVLALGVVIARRSFDLAVICVLTMALPAAQLWLLFDGQSAGWTRYTFTSAIFVGPLLLWSLVPAAGRRRSLSVALVILAMVANDAYAWTRLDDAGVRTDLRSPAGTYGFLTTLLGRHDAENYDPQVETEMAMAEALRETLFAGDPDAIVLVDNSQATRIILFSQHQDHFVSQDVIAFDEIVANPVGQVSYVLVPDTRVDRNEILKAYPQIFSGIYPQFELVAEFDGVFADAGNAFFRWGLFRVVNPGPAAHVGAAGS